MVNLDLVQWLDQHSVSSKREGEELVFLHSTGHTSIVLSRDLWRDGILTPRSASLRSFYESCYGASIGNGQIIVGTVVSGGAAVSHGFNIPDLEQLADQAKELGVRASLDGEIFIIEAGWMFLYSVERDGAGERLVRYDRDFHTVDRVPGIETVLDDWWKMVLDEPRNRG